MDQELIAYLDARFRELAQQMAEETAQQMAKLREETTDQIVKLREETIRRFEKGEETARHTVVLVEDLRHKLDVVAEGVIGANERLDRYRTEARVEFDQVKGWVEPYFINLNGRVRSLDNRGDLMGSRIDGMDSRLQILENRAERQQGDVMDAIRKMLGKPPLSPPATSE